MKDKTKKIIAGVGLGVLGMATLTGCTEMGFSVEQTDKIESLVAQSSNYMDSTLGLLEETNVNQQELLEELRKSNSKISVEQAAKLVNAATTKLLINSGDAWSNLIVKQTLSDVYDDGRQEEGYNSIYNIFKDSEGSYIQYEKYNGEMQNSCWAEGLFDSTHDIELPAGEEPASEVTSTNPLIAAMIYSDLSDMLGFGLIDESGIVNAHINEDNNYEIDCFADSRLINGVSQGGMVDYNPNEGMLCLSLKYIIDQDGRLLSMALEQVQYDEYENLEFMAKMETEITYGELTEESVYGALGVTSAAKPWKQSN